MAVDIIARGIASGKADLDDNGKVPAEQLPSYVDEVIEVVNKAALPATGTKGKIYVITTGTGVYGDVKGSCYRWSGSSYVLITDPQFIEELKKKQDKVECISLTFYTDGESGKLTDAQIKVLKASELNYIWLNDMHSLRFVYRDNANNKAVYATNDFSSDGEKAHSVEINLSTKEFTVYHRQIQEKLKAGKNIKINGTTINTVVDLDTLATKTELNTEKAARESGDKSLDAKITTEKAARETKDTELENKINEEAQVRESGDDELYEYLGLEKDARVNKDNELEEAIQHETIRAKLVESGLEDKKQNKLIAGENIELIESGERTIIKATGGGGGADVKYVVITGSSGTLTEDQLNTILNNKLVLIKHDDSYYHLMDSVENVAGVFKFTNNVVTSTGTYTPKSIIVTKATRKWVLKDFAAQDAKYRDFTSFTDDTDHYPASRLVKGELAKKQDLLTEANAGNSIEITGPDSRSHNLPKEYQELEYIEKPSTIATDNNLKIDLGLTGGLTQYGVTFKFTTGYSDKNYFILTNAYQTGYAGLQVSVSDTNKIAFCYYKSGKTTPEVIDICPSTTPITVSIIDTNIWYDNGSGAKKAGSFDSSAQQVAGPLTLWGTGTGTNIFNGYGKVYSLKIYNERACKTLIRDLIPCYRRADNAVGLYDLVNKVFYTNTGTGTFTKGDEISNTQRISFKNTNNYQTKTQVEEAISAHHDDTKQNKLTAGDNITITESGGKTIISAKGGEGKIKDFQINGESKVDAEGNVKIKLANNATTDESGTFVSAHVASDLSKRITSLESRGRFLSSIDCANKLVTTLPEELPYAYKSGDWFTVIADGNNKPKDGVTSIPAGATNIEWETGSTYSRKGDLWRFDGSKWIHESQSAATFESILGEPRDNTKLKAELVGIENEIEKEAQARESGDKELIKVAKELVAKEASLRESGDDRLLTIIAGKQDHLTAGKNINIYRKDDQLFIESENESGIIEIATAIATFTSETTLRGQFSAAEFLKIKNSDKTIICVTANIPGSTQQLRILSNQFLETTGDTTTRIYSAFTNSSILSLVLNMSDGSFKAAIVGDTRILEAYTIDGNNFRFIDHDIIYEDSTGITKLLSKAVQEEELEVVNSRIDTLESGLNDEAQIRESGDVAILNLLDKEVAARESGDNDLDKKIDNEATERILGDSNLQDQINSLGKGAIKKVGFNGNIYKPDDDGLVNLGNAATAEDLEDEVNRALAAESGILDALEAEREIREQADQDLNNYIATKQDILDEYLKNASVSGNTLNIRDKDGNLLAYTPTFPAVMRIRGTCLQADLPTSGQEEGDTYLLTDKAPSVYTGQMAIWIVESGLSDWGYTSASIQVDATITESGINPVEGRAIWNALLEKVNNSLFETMVAELESGIAKKQNQLIAGPGIIMEESGDKTIIKTDGTGVGNPDDETIEINKNEQLATTIGGIWKRYNEQPIFSGVKRGTLLSAHEATFKGFENYLEEDAEIINGSLNIEIKGMGSMSFNLAGAVVKELYFTPAGETSPRHILGVNYGKIEDMGYIEICMGMYENDLGNVVFGVLLDQNMPTTELTLSIEDVVQANVYARKIHSSEVIKYNDEKFKVDQLGRLDLIKDPVEKDTSVTDEDMAYTKSKDGKTILKAIPDLEVATEDETIAYLNDNFYEIEGNITNGMLDGNKYIIKDRTASVRIKPNAGFVAPEDATTINITNATLISYDKLTGEIVLGNAVGDVVITATCTK